MSRPGPVVIIGSGFGGLSSACYLADEGFDVTVLEKNDTLGGRASVLRAEGFRFDMGPSWYLMPDVFERFFGHFAREPSDFYDLEPLDPHYRIFFKDGDTAEITSDREEMHALFESYEPGGGDALDAYLETSERHYEVAMNRFVYEERPRLRDWIDLDVMRSTPIGLQLLGTMDGYVSKYFEHPKLRQIVQYSLVFLGGAPHNTPAIYNMMGHVDFNLGVYYPENGLRSVVDACVELGERLGVEYVTDAEVTEIDHRRDGFAVESVAGEFEADIVVSNADYAHTELELLPEQHRQYDEDYWESRTYSPSAFLLYLGVEGDLEPLEHHTLVLPTDWDRHFSQLFDDPAWPEDPAYYLCCPSKTDDSVAPDGHSNLFALVPVAPGLDDTDEVRTWYRDLVLDDVAEHTGTELRDRIVLEEQFTVSDFADRYNSTDGTALGLAHTLRQTALFRPSRRSSDCPGLYFTGAYTTPGIGVPMCLISGEHTADAVLEDVAR